MSDIDKVVLLLQEQFEELKALQIKHKRAIIALLLKDEKV